MGDFHWERCTPVRFSVISIILFLCVHAAPSVSTYILEQ